MLPEELQRIVCNRVRRMFAEGMKEEGVKVNMVILVRNVMEYENAEKNLRPKSLIQFVPKWATAIVSAICQLARNDKL